MDPITAGTVASVTNTPGLLKEIYGDLAKPGVQQVGAALAAVIGLGNTLLWPVLLANAKAKISLEASLDKYRKKMEKVDQSDVSEVPPEVGVPIAEKLTYVTNEELSNMYVELLAKASQKQSANLAHPSFVNIIGSISPDEAILLKSIRSMLFGIPFIAVRWQLKGQNEWHTINAMMPGVPCLSDLQFQQNIDAYISNLSGLGIFEIKETIFMVGENIYEPLEASARAKYAEIASTSSERELVFIRGKIEVTPFARMLLNACFSNDEAKT